MPNTLRRHATALARVASGQGGVLARAQLLDAGFTAQQARAELEVGRWQPLGPGIYLTHTGPVPPTAQIWAAVLHAGRGSACTGRTALWLAGALPEREAPSTIEIAIPRDRRVRALPGMVVVRQADLARHVLWSASPPRVRMEAAVLTATARMTGEEDVIALLLAAVQRRGLEAGRVMTLLSQRRGHRWSALLRDVLADAAEGVQSPLEHRYAVRVERRHRLPRGTCNHADRDSSGRRRFRDVRYRWGVLVELDGREAHPREWAHRDRRRDNDATLQGFATLRYGWREVATDACGVAAEVSQALRRSGWDGRPSSCGADCTIGSMIEW